MLPSVLTVIKNGVLFSEAKGASAKEFSVIAPPFSSTATGTAPFADTPVTATVGPSGLWLKEEAEKLLEPNIFSYVIPLWL
jgi:hypothetical protein